MREYKRGGGLEQCLPLSAVWVSQQAGQLTFTTDIIKIAMYWTFIMLLSIQKWRAWLAVLSGHCVLCGCSTLHSVPLMQLLVSSECSFLDVALLPRWPQVERRKGSTCPSTWALLWGWRLGYLYLAEFQVRDVMKSVRTDFGSICTPYSVFKPNISQETVSTENAW